MWGPQQVLAVLCCSHELCYAPGASSGMSPSVSISSINRHCYPGKEALLTAPFFYRRGIRGLERPSSSPKLTC